LIGSIKPVLPHHDKAKHIAETAQQRMYATLLAQPVSGVCFTRQTARTSAAPDSLGSIPGSFVLRWSFHNPCGGASQFAGGRPVPTLFPILTPASSAA
jgi:hypothetical protein